MFFLTFDDLKSKKNLKLIAKKNKEEYQKYLQITSVPRFILSTGECIYGVKEGESDKVLVGVPISSGEYEGIVKVVTDPQNANLKQGEILVTHSTDPSWTPLFLNAGALIMETGGTVSHGGIVAREYGIPAVAGIENVTVKLKDGQKVKVNGETGEVLIRD